MANEKTSEIADRKLVFIKPPEGTKRVYCNYFQIGQTVFDIRVMLGEITNIDDEEVEITQNVEVTLTWLEAKALSQALAAFVENYEKAYGRIRTEFTSITNPDMPPIPNILPPESKD